MDWTADHFPEFEEGIRRLAQEHRAFADEPLHLAILYDPRREGTGDVFLFEVVGNFGAGAIDPDSVLLETAFEPASDMNLRNRRLRLVLTSPEEFRAAASGDWPQIQELKGSIGRGEARVLFQDDIGKDLGSQIGVR